ncbi:RICIN domain-containing protein [Bacteroides pyogenes]|uniref:RICIN domain-containing protein n=1 Tax=Bacteroides pyogenes TaxID=310300 RepID=UPI001F29718C|nr:RICIN domain-containing protein [Bacteroides pyogenes]MCF2709760.1 family 16 glycosylhydrolase [Bacteroides pyogenes]
MDCKKILISSLLISFISCNLSTDFEPITQEEKSNYLGTRSQQSLVIFEDDFEQTGRIPDTTKWSLCPRIEPAWGKHLSESYDQAFVENGNLVLLAEKKEGEYKAGGIQTLGKFDFQYGKVEVCARFTKTAQGGWPAIWMMPSIHRYAGSSWPACGEIDIMEQLNHQSIVHQTIHSHYKNTLHFYLPVPAMISSYKRDEYNVYGLEWTPDYLIFSINGQSKLKYPNMHFASEPSKKQWPFNAPFYLILNYALGGPDTWPGEIKDADLPAKMEIDWVRIYSHTLSEHHITSGDTYNILTALNAKSAVDVAGAGTTDGTSVILWHGNSAVNQKWIVTELDNGYYRLSPVYVPDQALSAPLDSSATNQQLEIRTYKGELSQQWKIKSVGNGFFTLSPASSPEMSMDVIGEETEDGTSIALWKTTEKINQRFMFKKTR